MYIKPNGMQAIVNYSELFCKKRDNEFIEINTKLSKNGMVLEFVPYNERTLERCLIALKSNINSIKFIPKKYQTEDMLTKVLLENGLLLTHIPLEDRTPEFCKMALSNNTYALKYVPRTPSDTFIELAKYSVSLDGLSIRYLESKWKTYDICKIAYENNKESVVYFSKAVVLNLKSNGVIY